MLLYIRNVFCLYNTCNIRNFYHINSNLQRLHIIMFELLLYESGTAINTFLAAKSPISDFPSLFLFTKSLRFLTGGRTKRFPATQCPDLEDKQGNSCKLLKGMIKFERCFTVIGQKLFQSLTHKTKYKSELFNKFSAYAVLVENFIICKINY